MPSTVELQAQQPLERNTTEPRFLVHNISWEKYEQWGKRLRRWVRESLAPDHGRPDHAD